MRLAGERIAQLHIPRQPNREAARMFRQPPVVMPAALTEPSEFGRETDHGHEQHIGHQLGGMARRLQGTVGASFKVAVGVGIGVSTESHRRTAPGKVGEGDGVTSFVKEARIGARRRLPPTGVVEANHRQWRNTREQRLWRAMEQQAADPIRQRLDVGAPPGAQSAAKVTFDEVSHSGQS